MNDQLNQIFGNVDLSINRPQPDEIMSTFPVITYPSIESLSQQQQVGANQVRSASFKGTQNINGNLDVIDATGTGRVRMGFQKGMFLGQDFGIRASKDQIDVGTATGTQLTYDSDFSTEIWYDEDEARVLLGYQKGGFGANNYGIKISQNGFDVRAATDSQLIMSSGFNSFKIIQTGTNTLPNFSVGSSGAAFNYDEDLGNTLVTHNLGFVPIGLVFLNLSGSYHPLPTTLLGSSGPGLASWKTWDIYTTATQLKITRSATTFNDTAAFTGDQVKWYLLQETAA